MKHTNLTHPPAYICDDLGCTICELFICSVCGGAEGSLTTDCPGVKVPYEVGQRVYAGEIDYINGVWRSGERMTT
jgi:hypothetical protein